MSPRSFSGSHCGHSTCRYFSGIPAFTKGCNSSSDSSEAGRPASLSHHFSCISASSARPNAGGPSSSGSPPVWPGSAAPVLPCASSAKELKRRPRQDLMALRKYSRPRSICHAVGSASASSAQWPARTDPTPYRCTSPIPVRKARTSALVGNTRCTCWLVCSCRPVWFQRTVVSLPKTSSFAKRNTGELGRELCASVDFSSFHCTVTPPDSTSMD
mmetsp:Transcript_67004/g.195918  ORF Transcript_67004/g.195918 Transcript_67004/m.195918 type:complete len:215 (-) Transcript_67004:216-860(-)